MGYFFIPSYPYINKDFLSPHKIHILLGKYDVDEISDYINKFIKDNNIRIKNKYLFTSKDLQLSKTKSDKLKKFFVKENYIIQSIVQGIIDKPLIIFLISKNKKKKKSFYLSIDQIKKLTKWV